MSRNVLINFSNIINDATRYIYTEPLLTTEYKNTQSLTLHTHYKHKTRWLYCVECQQYCTRPDALGCLCDCV